MGAQDVHMVEETVEETETETVEKDTIDVNATIDNYAITDEAGKAKETEIGTNKPIPEDVIDEVCPNEEYSEAKFISTSTSTRKPFLS